MLPLPSLFESLKLIAETLTAMGKKLERRPALLQRRTKLKLQARKANAPARGIKTSNEEENRAVLDGVLAKISKKD